MSTEDVPAERGKLSPAKLGLLEKRLERARQQRAEARLAAVQAIPVRQDKGPAPLSFAQQRLWFIDQLEPGSVMYIKPNAVRLTGRLNVGALEKAISEIIRRHEIFRTVFVNNDGHPAQVVNPHQPLQLVPVDLSGKAQSDREMLVQHLINEEGARPFDLMRGPVIRVSLFKLGEDDHVAIFTMHHIVSDGWSIGVLVREIVILYSAFAAGRPSPIPELPIQYADFAVWQREWLQGEVLESNLEYWRRQLRGVPAQLELPTDRPRSNLMTHRGARHFMKFSDELAQSLRDLSRREGVTLFMTMLTAWQVLLSRYSRQTDIAVGTSVANRNRSETEPLIGFFVNTLVMRTDLGGDPSFSEALQRVKDVALGAYAHQDLPFEKLVEELQPERSMNHTPLFQVMFGMENTPEKDLNLPGLTMSPVQQRNETTIFDLSVGIFERSNQMTGLLEYSTDLFEAGTIERMARHFTMLLEAAVQDPSQPISSLSLLTSDERQRVLVEWNRTATDYPRDLCIHELFEREAERHPEAVALTFGQEEVTYGELNARANRMAHYLRGLGVGAEVMVGLMVERRVELVVGLLGILKAGGTYLPLDPLYPAERLAFMIEDARMAVLLTEDSLLDNLPADWGSVVSLDGAWDLIARESEENPANVVAPENLAYVMYTSGSTGRPKGVCVTHRNVVRLVKETNYARLDGEVFLQLAPISFDASTFEVWGALLNGARLVIFPPERPSLEQLSSTLRLQQVTALWLTAGLFHQMVERQVKGLQGVRQLLAGGDVLMPAAVQKVLHEVPGCRVINGYGPTEATTFTTFHPMDDASQVGSNVPIGRPIANTEVYVLDEMLRPVGIGLPGELCIGGDGLARGYLRRADLTAERFVPDPFSAEGSARLYRTGDTVRYLEDGRIEFLGRADGQVKVRGFRVELGEIEAAMSEHPAVSAAVVVARRESDGGKQLVGYFVGGDGEPLTGQALREWMRGRVPDYMIPNVFIALDELPLTPNGKVDRRALPDPSHAPREESRSYVAPRTAVEEVLCGVWAEVLKVEKVGVHDNFFDLGGHSLLATQLISHVREALGVELALMKLFEQPTVAGFATAVEVELSKAAGLAAPPVVPVPRDEPLPLSFAQQRLWFIDQLQPMSPVYNIPTAIRLSGRLDFDVTQRTLNEVVRRHESLRTTFPSSGGEPVQLIHQPTPVEIPLTDLTHLPEEEREQRMRQLAAQEAKRPFDLTKGPLLRVGLVRLAPEEHVALFTMHHIVSDGWSLGILVREIAALYTAYIHGDESPLPELAVQYGDFAAWQRDWLQGEVLDRQLGYWKERLAGAPPALELPTDHPRPSVMTQRGATHPFTIGGEVSRGLQELSRREGVTLFMVLLAAFDVLLQRYTGSEDVVVGTPIAGRNRSETENLIGFFVNTLVMRTDLGGDPGFRELLERVKQGALGAYAHQDLPFEKLVEELSPERSLSHTPLFQVMMVLQNAPQGELELPGLKLSAVASAGEAGGGAEGSPTKFELTLTMYESRDGLRCLLHYNRDLFEPGTMERFARHFTMLLDGILADVTQPVSALPLLTSSERQELLVDWNDTATDYPRDLCIQELFERQSEREPDAVALTFGEGQMTYGELNARANRLAHHLRRQGVGADVLVGVMMERSADMLVALLGILKAGGAYLPLDPLYPAERLAFMLEDTQTPVLLTQESLLHRLPLQATTVLCLDTQWEQVGAESGENPETVSAPDNMAYVMYTSGSTGRPKGVCVTHRNVVRLVRETNYADFNSGEVFLQLAPISFDASTFEIWGALLNGARLALMPPQPPTLEEIAQALRHYGVTTLWLTAGLFHQMVDDQLEELRRVRQLLAGGDVLSVSHVTRVLEGLGGRRLINGYGPTETTTFACCHVMGEGSELGATVPIGRPISNTELYVLDAQMQPLPVGAVGHLYIGGEGVARGYLRRPGLTAERFIPHPFAGEAGARLYKTGDLARYLAGGELEFLGRADGQVKLRGYRVELGEVEAALKGHPSVQEAVVEVRTEAGGDKRLVAYVVSEGGEAIGGPQLREWLRQRVPEYMVPGAFVPLNELPLTPNGKVDRRALPDPSSARPEELRSYVAPRTAIEEVLCGVWAEVLKVEKVGVHDNFFDLGGHSLLATQLMSRVRDGFKVELPLRALFEQPTVAGLSLSIEAAGLSGPMLLAPPIVPVPRDEPLPLSFAQQRLWFIDQLQPLSPAYNVPTSVRLTGQLNLEVTQRTFDEVVRRHEALRTTFPSVDGQPMQLVHPPSPVEIPLTDLSDLPEEEREQRVRQLVMAEARRPFDLTAGPLLRVSLIRLAPEDHVALFTMHHIVSDGWSMGLLVQEVAALYGAYARGEESPLPELTVQYGDFAAWQRGWLQGEVLEAQVAYWKQQLAGAPPALELPTDRPRPAVMTQRGATHSFALSGEVSRGLQELSRREGVTLFMVLLAAFDILLQRYTGRDDVVVGTPIAGRNRAEVEGLIGFFVNTLVLRTDLSGDPSFRELLGRVREASLGAYAHQDLPFEKLVEELSPERTMSHTPLFQVMLVLQNAPQGELELPGLKLSPVGASDGAGGGEGTAAKFELTLTVIEGRDGLRCAVNYNRDLFEAGTVERLGRHLARLLGEAAGRASEPISRLEMLSEAERREQLVAWNQTRVEYGHGQGVVGLFEGAAAREPGAAAVVSGEEEVTYGELNERANRLAHYLRAQGVGAEELVAVHLGRGAELVVALLGVLKAGAAYVPLDPSYPAERLGFILREAQARFVLTEAGLLSRLPSTDARPICLDDDWELVAAESPDNPVGGDTDSEALAYVLYTSGSTGQPKGVCVTRRGLANYLNWALAEYLREGAGRGAPVHSSVGFDLTVTSLFVPLLAGRGVEMLAEEPGVDGLLEALRRGGDFSLVKLTPAHLKLLGEQADPGEVGAWARALVIGGEALSAEDVSLWRMHAPGVRLINEYGPTETVVGCATYEVGAGTASAGAVPIGRPIANTQLYVLDARMGPLPVGAVGELYIGGAGVARGYLRRPGMTAERFVPHPFSSEPGARLYKTGDLARYLAGGELEYVGRADTQVKVRGYRIELGEVEESLRAHPSVQEAVVEARAEAGGGRRLVAYVVGAEGESVAGSQLREWLRQRVPEYMVPGAFVPLNELPLTPNGKVDRKALPDPEPGSNLSSRNFVAPRDADEVQLAKIWEEVLGVESVGARDNFFDLGGHSMIATRMMYRIQQVFGRKIPLAALFESPTVEHLARVLRDQTETRFSSLVQIQAGKDSRTPLFCPHASGGNILCYADVARHIGSDQPIYGLQSLALGKEHAPHTTIEEMAAYYVEQVRRVQPEGPYYLGGWSMGGVVAFEMAQQLRAQGQEVAKLFLIDVLAPSPAGAIRSLAQRAQKAWSKFDKEDALRLTIHFAQDIGLNLMSMPAWREQLEALKPDEQLAWVVREAKQYQILPADMSDEEVAHLFELFRTNVQARQNYAGRTYHGRVRLFIAEERFLKSIENPTTGWAKLVPSGLDYEAIPGDHYTMIRKSNARVLAERLRLFLDEPPSSK